MQLYKNEALFGMKILFYVYLKKRTKYVLKIGQLRYILWFVHLSLLYYLCISWISWELQSDPVSSLFYNFILFCYGNTSLTSFTFCALCLLSRSSVLVFSSSRKQMYKLGNRFLKIQTLYIINSSMQKMAFQQCVFSNIRAFYKGILLKFPLQSQLPLLLS